MAPPIKNSVYALIQSHLKARFATETCREALSNFEVQYPVSFAIELQQLQDEKPTDAAMAMASVGPSGSRSNALRQTQLPISARLGALQASTLTSTRGLSSSVGGRLADSRGRQRGRQPGTTESDNQPTTNISDEADSFKKMRRQTYYRECSRQFIRYFSDAGTRYMFDINTNANTNTAFTFTFA